MSDHASAVLAGINLSGIPIAVLVDMQAQIGVAIKSNLVAASDRLWPSYEPRTVNMPPVPAVDDPNANSLFTGTHALDS